MIAPLGGDRASILAASPVANQCGVSIGMALHKARRICRDLITLPMDESYYASGNIELASILQHLSPVVEPYRFGRAHSDLTKTAKTFSRAEDQAHRTLKEIHAQLGLQGTIGIGANKLVSRIVSQVAPAKSIQTINEGSEQKFLAPLWSNYLPSVNVSLWDELLELNLLRIGDIAQFSQNDLAMVFGKTGDMLYEHSHGIDNTPVIPPKAEAEITHGDILMPDTNELQVLETSLLRLAEKASFELRQRNLWASRLRLEITYIDSRRVVGYEDLKTPLSLSRPLFDHARLLLLRILKRRIRVGSILFRLSSLSRQSTQLDLFASSAQTRSEKLQTAVEKIRSKFGDEAARFVRVHEVPSMQRSLLNRDKNRTTRQRQNTQRIRTIQGAQ